jgi:long-chain acyl-CoA synthetase
LFKSILKQLNPSLRLFISGAAPLSPNIVTGFGNLGIRVIQGYGLTETSPVVSATNDFVDKPATIGYPMAGIEVTIDSPDESGVGELITRGKNVMLGYYENQEATDEVIDSDGWFRTGDLATIDSEGFIKITGRAKSMIVLTNGKKAFPEEYELLLNKFVQIKESYVWGYETPYKDIQICAKIVIDKEVVLSENPNITEKEISDRISEIIKGINQEIPAYKIIRYFLLTYEELIKTTTLKVKRPLENEKMDNLLTSVGVGIRKISGQFIEKL